MERRKSLNSLRSNSRDFQRSELIFSEVSTALNFWYHILNSKYSFTMFQDKSTNMKVNDELKKYFLVY
ncbi:MAG: hypothetical protein Q4A09_06420 [Capnocytophaga felis]|nr:hypothetical protein [Capnocytophaga felis]